MIDIHENALIILRAMSEAGIGVRDTKTYQEVAELSGLDEEAFKQADGFLLEGKYIKATIGKMGGTRELTAEGLKYLQETMTKRLPLSRDAERVLRYTVNYRGPRSPFLARGQIISELGLSDTRYDIACQQLQNLALIEDTVDQGFCEIIKANQAGKRAVQYNFRSMEAPITYMSTTFDQRGQQVTYQYNAAGDINFGAVQNRMDLIGQLEKLKDELTRAADAQVIDAEVVTDARYEIEKAVNQAKKPEPDKQVIQDRLDGAKRVLDGITAAAGMVGALAKAAEVVQNLF